MNKKKVTILVVLVILIIAGAILFMQKNYNKNMEKLL